MPVRPTEPCDWETLRDVRLRALQDAPWAFGSTFEDEVGLSDGEWRERAGRPGTFLAGDVGMAGGFVTSPGIVRLWGMWIAPEARGRGLAEALVDAVEAWARSIGAQELELAVSERADAARAAYTRMGFELMPEREPLQAAGDLYTRRMRRRLNLGHP